MDWDKVLIELNTKINERLEGIQRADPTLQNMLGQRHIVLKIVEELKNEKNDANIDNACVNGNSVSTD